METTPNTHARIVFFDGMCVLCNRFVGVLCRYDRNRRYRFAHLHGLTAFSVLNQNDITLNDSVIFIHNGSIFRNSEAVIRILIGLGGIWKIFFVFYMVPPFIRDFIYRIIAKYRYFLFGKSTVCRIPNDNEAIHFLP